MKSNISQSAQFDIRYSNLSDAGEIKKWLKDKGTGLWYPPETDPDIESFVRNWIGFTKYKASLTAVFEGNPVGVATIYLMPYIKVSHVCMVCFIVDPAHQRQGVGKSLIKNIKHLAKTRFRLESMHCEIYEGCPAVPALKENGFSEIIRQENFVYLPDGPKARLIFESKL